MEEKNSKIIPHYLPLLKSPVMFSAILYFERENHGWHSMVHSAAIYLALLFGTNQFPDTGLSQIQHSQHNLVDTSRYFLMLDLDPAQFTKEVSSDSHPLPELLKDR